MTSPRATPPALSYEVCGLQLRGPRVAVVFESGPHWQFWARHAMQQITTRWAGAGFVLAPHDHGKISRRIVDAIRVYDPDFVVVSRQPVKLPEKIEPGTITETFETEPAHTTLGPFLDRDQTIVWPESAAARQYLAERCNPYVRQDDYWDECQIDLDAGVHGQLPTTAAAGAAARVCVAVPGTWGGSIATAAAATLGVLEEPHPDAAAVTEGDPAVLGLILGVPYGSPPNTIVHSPNGLAMSVDISRQPSALDLTIVGLSKSWSHGDDRTTRWIVGSAADDYALAMILDRMHGKTHWIDPAWLLDPDVATVVQSAGLDVLGRHDNKLALSSASLDAEALQQWADTLDAEATIAAPEAAAGTPVRRQLGPRLYGYTVTGQHDRRHTLPMLHHPDGTIEIAAAAPLPTLEPDHPLDTAVTPVQVDLTIPDGQMPAGRGFDPHRLAGDNLNERYQTWIRSSRTGLTYQSMRFDLVVSGATKYGILATPRLTVPGLDLWTTHLAAQAGYETRPSDAGRKTAVLAQLWGGRDQMTKAIGSPLQLALTQFTPPKKDQNAYLDGEAVRVTSGRGVLTFKAIRSFWPTGTDELEIRQVVDDLTNRRILRRGLLLKCPECSRLDFFALDQLAQTVDCSLCGSQIRLIQPNWHLPHDEPRWFYDAHPAARTLTSTNSDVPLLLAHHLRLAARHFTHIGELELIQNNKSVAETDLVALTDNVLSVAEAKINTDLGAGGGLPKAIRKRILAAQTLRADQIILATTKTAWPQSTVDQLRTAIADADWLGPTPSVRLITGLRTQTVNDETVN